jgi:hypothetical protein
MTETTLPLFELLQEQEDGDFLRAAAGLPPLGGPVQI